MKDLNLDELSDTEFEQLAFDLLHELKFVNIDWRKGTGLKSSPADRGRDIVAYQDRVDVDKSRHLEKWFVDCKHYKKGVPPTELRNLLTWCEAERPDVALFCGLEFSLKSVERLLGKLSEEEQSPSLQNQVLGEAPTRTHA